jgi:outer membrane protein assembly factor BamB
MTQPLHHRTTLVIATLAAILSAAFAGCRTQPVTPPTPVNPPAPVPATRPAEVIGWPMWGRTPNRNMVSPEKDPPVDWNWDADDPTKNKNIKWTVELGSKSYGNPCVANGMVAVGTNNFGPLADPRTLGPNGRPTDGGVEMAVDELTGKLLWQDFHSKLPSPVENDWPGEGICSAACAEPGHLWFCTNQCHLVCLGVDPANGKQPRVAWDVDMVAQLGVYPHNMTSSSPVIDGDLIYVLTGNGVNRGHNRVVAPDAADLVCFNKNTGAVVWADNSPGPDILHGQWSSAAIAVVNGRHLVIAPMGDAWVRAFDARTGNLVWRFDANLKKSSFPQGGRNEIIATPCIIDNRWMYIATGQDPEHSTGYANLWCVDITRTGDISAEIDDPAFQQPVGPLLARAAGHGIPNPNSGVRWLLGPGHVGDVEGKRMHRTMATATVYNGLVFIPDFSGYLHCLDAGTGKQYWFADLECEIWGSCLACDGKIYVGDKDGDVTIFAADKTGIRIAQHNMDSSVLTSPVYANGTLYILSMTRLFAISEKKTSPISSRAAAGAPASMVHDHQTVPALKDNPGKTF